MGGALEWISEIVSWFGQFIPRWIILNTTEGAVKFVRGWKVVSLGPGWHIYWPVTTKLQQYPTARQAEELRAQTLVTRDDKTIIVGGLIVYEVSDIEKLVAHTYLPQQTIKDIALTAVHDVCCLFDLPALMDENRRGTLDTKLRNESQKALKDYGVKVLKLVLVDLSPCKVIKLIQSMSKGED